MKFCWTMKFAISANCSNCDQFFKVILTTPEIIVLLHDCGTKCGTIRDKLHRIVVFTQSGLLFIKYIVYSWQHAITIRSTRFPSKEALYMLTN